MKLSWFACIVLATSTGAAVAATPKPNIVFILADDLGYGDVGCYGQTKIKTPNIDRMAAEGMRFTNFYCGAAVCAPSRCTLMTGKHLGHATIRDNMQREPGAEGQHAMQPGTVTVAQLLKSAGYTTAIVGKWGLGMPVDHSSPLGYGFDHHYGYLCQGMAHTYYPPYLWRDDKQELLPGNPDYSYGSVGKGRSGLIEPSGKLYSHDLMANDALAWVAQHQREPFFLYLAFTIPHLSLQVPEDSLAEYRGQWPETPMTTSKHYANHSTPRAAYAAMITRMDRDIGRLMAELKKLGLDDNTLVFFGSDNGAVFPIAGTDPQFFHSNGNLRGYKQDLYDGGIRTPFIARWPGHIKAGTTSDLVGAYWDMLPTLCDIAGTKPPADIDGLSIAPTLLGEPGQKRHEYLYWEYESAGRAQAVRFGDWKAVRNHVNKSPNSTPELYNLASDPSESKNVAAENPDVAAKAAAYMKAAHTPSWEPKWDF
ncbi:MAG TPA: arylsulfatase [Pirellulales bacterium]|jgi:arylsulfatase|nr:arylsulfatase [Pirellulales bacterium]